MQLIRLPLEGTKNTRDIGGYVGANNKSMSWNRILRSDCLSRLTTKDKTFLIEGYKLSKVIDLRSEEETRKAPNALLKDERIEYLNISLSGDVNPTMMNTRVEMSETFLQDFYFDLIENKKENIKEIISSIAETKMDESVVFHCTAGKDRTGVITMLLLGIIGVSRQDISTNYMQTAANLKYDTHFMSSMTEMATKYESLLGKGNFLKLATSNEEDIENAYDKLVEKYENFYNYFLSLGFIKEEIEQLINNITISMTV